MSYTYILSHGSIVQTIIEYAKFKRNLLSKGPLFNK